MSERRARLAEEASLRDVIEKIHLDDRLLL